jgi:formylmethanofuran dehydrogenase subunit C
VSEAVTLSLRAAVSETIVVEGLSADRCASLSEAQIARLPVWRGSERGCVGDLFEVRGGGQPRLWIEGALGHVEGLAAGNRAGEVVIDGDAGTRTAAGMTGGRVEVRGHVGHDAGMALAGGLLLVHGGAGDRLGAAVPGASRGMTGGEILVTGSAGTDVAARMRRGLVVVGGEVRESAGRAMIAGTIAVLGSIGPAPGCGNKRGSIVAGGAVEVPSTYRYACTFESGFVRLLMTYLVRQHGLALDPRLAGGPYRRYCGDAGEPGKGEILVLARGR